LSNTEVIAIDQDTTGLQAHLVSDNGQGLQVWAKNLNGKLSNERAVALFNRSSESAPITVYWDKLNLSGKVFVRDLWLHTDLGYINSSYTTNVPSHGVVLLKVVGTQTRLQEVYEAEHAWINSFNLTQYTSLVANQGRAVLDVKCSGGARVEQLGKSLDNYIEFRDIYADTSKSYHLTISYLCNENRNISLSVNGIDTLLTNMNSGGWTTINDCTVNVKLNKGYNSIRLSNSTDWLPDIDKIQIDLDKNSTSNINTIDSSNFFIKVYPNPCSSFLQIDTELPIKHVDIFSLSGVMLNRFYQSRFSVNNLDSGMYILKVSFERCTKICLIIKI
jgi:hypothetical protein